MKRNPSKRDLQARVKELETATHFYRQKFDDALVRQKELEAKLAAKIDMSMIEARTHLAYALGGMTEAVSKAITMIVGKEVM